MMRPFPLVSLSDAINIQGGDLAASLACLASYCQYFRVSLGVTRGTGTTTKLDVNLRQMLLAAQVMMQLADKLDMAVTKASAARLINELSPRLDMTVFDERTLGRLAETAFQLSFTFPDELAARTLLVMPSGNVRYYEPSELLFGPQVEDAFPSSAPEIADAGRCRALGMWTACVMHLMRAVEPALNALAARYSVQPDQNWNTALNQIEAKLRGVQQSRDGAEAEQWASEAAVHLRGVKNAWRNHAMHGRARYNEDEAVKIYNSVQALMQQLAEQLHE